MDSSHQKRQQKSASTSSTTSKGSQASTTSSLPVAAPVNLQDYDIVGFDLDGCIAEYDREATLKALHSRMRPFLDVPEVPGPHKISSWVQTGLVLDIEEGLMVKLNYNRGVAKALRGFKNEPLESDAVKRVEARIKKHYATDDVLPGLTSTGVQEGWRRTGLKMFLDMLELPAAYAAMQILSTESSGGHFYERIQSAWEAVFDSEDVVSAQYVLPCSETVKTALSKLVDGRYRAIFLLTSSSPRRCATVVKAALGPEWQKYFNFVVTEAPKPWFFLQDDPFSAVDAGNLSHLKGVELSVPIGGRGMILSHGSFSKLVHQAKRITGSGTPRCVFLGDNVVQDILGPRLIHSQDCPAVDTIAVISDFKSRMASSVWGPINYGKDYDESLMGGIARRCARFSVSCLADALGYSRDS